MNARCFQRLCMLLLAATTSLTAAEYEPSNQPLWSLQPLTRPPLPESDADLTHPIDRFLEKEREARGLQTVGRADKLTLLRRVTLDLVGLPPTPEEQEA